MLSCVSNAAVFNRGEWRKEGAESWFAFHQNPAHLGDSGLNLYFAQCFSVAARDDAPDRWKIKTLKYEYVIGLRDPRQELFAYHWERGRQIPVPYAHLHIGFGASMAAPPVDPKIHVPTDRVPIEDIVFFLIDQLGVKPLRNDWREILTAARARFIQFKTE